MSFVQCQNHQQQITRVCLQENCDNRLLCLQCFSEHNQNHIYEILGSEQVYDVSKKVILMDSIIKMEKDKIEGKKEVLVEKKEQLTNSIKEQFDIMQQKLVQILQKKQEATFEIIENYFKNDEDLLNQMFNKIEKIQNTWVEKSQNNKKKMLSLKEKIQDNLEYYLSLKETDLQVLNENLEIFEMIIEKKGQNLVNKGIIEPFSVRFENELDKLSFIKTQSLGKLQIDIKQLEKIEMDCEFMAHDDWITGVSQINKANMVATGSNDNTVKIFNLSTQQSILDIKNHTQGINDLLYLGEDLLISACQDGFLRIFNTNHGEIFDFFLGHEGGIKCLCKVGDVNDMVYATGGGDQSICIRNAKEKILIHKIEGVLESNPMCITHSQENNMLIAGDFKGILYIFDLKTEDKFTLEEKQQQLMIREATIQQQAHDSAIKSVIFVDEDQKIFASGSQDYSIKVWKIIEDNQELQNLQTYKEHDGSVNSLLNLNSNRYFMSGGWDTKIKVWDIKKNKSIYTNSTEDNFIDSMGYLNDGKTIVTGGSDHKIRVFKIPFSTQKYNLESFIQENVEDILESQKKQLEQGNTQCECSIF